MSDLTERLVEAVGGRYDVEREIGRGGMAVVYLARDVRLDRAVAIKVLEPDAAGEIGAERFLREVRLASQLLHPHILAVHESGESAGLLYYIMPFVDGESLRDRLRREGQLPLDDSLRIARQVADALAYAHVRGVIHRDIKPENILLSRASDHAMVADFGIAKALGEASERERLTLSGLSVGTPAYMSPEQAAGERVLDARTDIYALGSVLFEMLAGEPPFTGPTAQAVIAKRLSQPAPSVQIVRPVVPGQVATAIARALEMVPADRFPSASAFHAALEPTINASWGGPGQAVHGAGSEAPAARTSEGSAGSGGVRADRRPGMLRRGRIWLALGAVVILGLGFAAYRQLTDVPDQTRLVVLPFENQGEPDDAYLVDGITGELTDKLASISSLGVIARTSAVHYRGTRKRAREVARELRVQYLIGGTVHRSRRRSDSDSVRISVWLVRARDETQIWSDDYDVAVTGVAALQSSVAESVTTKMHAVLDATERQRLADPSTANGLAYDHYLRGLDHYNRSWSRPDVEGAVAQYERAVGIDPDYALAWAGLAQAHAWMHQLRYDLSESRLIAAKLAADRALALDGDLPDAHVALGLYYYWGRNDYERAIEEFTRARALQPSNAHALLQIGNVRRRQGRFAEAIESYEASAELDPRSHRAWFNLGETLLFTRQYERARAPLERVTALAPEFLEGYVQRARLLMNASGDTAAARVVLRQAEERIPPTAWRGSMMDFARVLYHPHLDDLLRRIHAGAYGLDSGTYHVTKGILLFQLGRRDSSLVQFDSARVHLERMRDDRPEQAWIHGQLALAYAGLGRRDDAIRTAEQAQMILPVASDALDGPEWIMNLGRVYALLGDAEGATQAFTNALAIPSWVSSQTLRIDPLLAGLRTDPGFARLIVLAR